MSVCFTGVLEWPVNGDSLLRVCAPITADKNVLFFCNVLEVFFFFSSKAGFSPVSQQPCEICVQDFMGGILESP